MFCKPHKNVSIVHCCDVHETWGPWRHHGRACPGAQELVPPAGKGALYLRPLLLGTGPLLGLGPAPSYTFVVYGAAVGAYFKVGAPAPSGGPDMVWYSHEIH